MKIAVASENEFVAGHFGHCPSFNIFETEQDKVINNQQIDNPGHRPGFLPNFLNELGVKVIISGGMGGRAIELFQEKGIEVIVGAEGRATDAVDLYLKGDLKSSGSVCSRHEHHGSCGGHGH